MEECLCSMRIVINQQNKKTLPKSLVRFDKVRIFLQDNVLFCFYLAEMGEQEFLL